MRVEIARVSPSRQILSTWGTKAAVEQQPAIIPTIVGSQLCMTFPRGEVVGDLETENVRWVRKWATQGQSCTWVRRPIRVKVHGSGIARNVTGGVRGGCRGAPAGRARGRS